MFPSIIAAPAGLCNCPGRGAARGAAAHWRDRRGQDRAWGRRPVQTLRTASCSRQNRAWGRRISGAQQSPGTGGGPVPGRCYLIGVIASYPFVSSDSFLHPVLSVAGWIGTHCEFSVSVSELILFWCWQILSFRHIPETVLSKSFVSLFDPGGLRVRPGPRALGGPAACADPCRNFRPALTIHSRFGAVLIWCTFSGGHHITFRVRFDVVWQCLLALPFCCPVRDL